MTKSVLDSELLLPCGISIPNRIGKSAMTEGLADRCDNATKFHSVLYRTWAEGGLGLSISGNIMVDRRYLERAGNIVLEDESGLQELSNMAEAGKEQGGSILGAKSVILAVNARGWSILNHWPRQRYN